MAGIFIHILPKKIFKKLIKKFGIARYTVKQYVYLTGFKIPLKFKKVLRNLYACS